VAETLTARVRQRLALPGHGAGIRREHAHPDPHRRLLARPVSAHATEHLPPPASYANPVQVLLSPTGAWGRAEVLAQITDLQHQVISFAMGKEWPRRHSTW